MTEAASSSPPPLSVESSTRPATRLLAALGEEAAGVAHDFDNTLTAITAHATLLRQSQDPETRQRAEAILRACRVGRQVVERVRRSVRPDTRPTRVRVELAELVAEALAVAEVRASQRGVRLTHALRPAQLAGEPAELQQAILNVLHNSVDAARSLVHLELTTDAETVHIDIRDDGPGVPEPLRDAIFTAWVSTRGEAGTGLGLPQARRVAKDLGGNLTLLASSPAGSTFRFELPLALDAALPAARPLTGFEVQALTTPITALVVDDDPDTREALAELLELSGFRVTAAASAGRALSILASSPPFGILLTDIELGLDPGHAPAPHPAPPAPPAPPGPGGLALIRRAAALDPTLPILVVSGTNPDTIPPALLRRVAGHLVKPVSPARLIEHAQRLARLDPTSQSAEPR